MCEHSELPDLTILSILTDLSSQHFRPEAGIVPQSERVNSKLTPASLNFVAKSNPWKDRETIRETS
jgi:hypothetical protein